MMAGFTADKEMPDFMVGSCLTMCPSAEVRLRQTEGLLHTLEKAVNANGEKMNYGNPRFMVKEFSRSAAGHEIKPSDVRPLPVLAKTVKFLLTNSCCREDVPWALIYQFVSDRLRAVRQDLCVQGVKNLDCIKIHLASVRFHVYSHYRMCEHELADFDPYLNKKMLLETLTLILALYRDLDKEAPDTREEYPEPQFENDENWTEEESEESEEKITKDSQTSEKNFKEETTAASLSTKLGDLELQERDGEGIESESFVPGCSSQTDQTNTESESRKVYKSIESYSSREEAEAFYIIVNFGSEDALSHALTLPKHIRCSPLVSLVLGMSTSWLTHNYSRVIHLSTFLPPLFLCAFHPHIAEVERKALSILSRSHSCKGQVYKKDDLAKLFFSDHMNMQKACDHYGIDLKESGAIFIKGSFKEDAPLRKVTRLEWIEERLNKIPLSELLVPQDLQDEDFSSLPVDLEIEEEVMLAPGCGTTDEACSKKDDMQDLAGDEHNRCIGSIAHPEPAEISTKFPIDTGVSVPDQDYVVKLLLQSSDKKCGAVQEHEAETCSEPFVSELLLSKASLNKDCTNKGNEEIFFKSAQMMVKETPELLEINNSISFSLEQTNLNGSIQLSGKTSLTSEDSGVSCDSVDQVLCDSTSSQDSSILANEISKDVSENFLGDSPDQKIGCSHQVPVPSCSVPEALLLEESVLQKSSVKKTNLSSSHEPSKDDTPVEVMNENSIISSPEISKTGLRQRKNLEKKEAIAKKVQKMKEKQIASENWIKKKQLMYKPLTITLGILSLGVIGLLLYQNFNP
ncbi:uncharacterized protein [Palaemon carinicauda]|uniref:uncharacterized protein n=1 Tax=Palaemon carinicauda TaxID=392227 RepID=UPI0035B5DFBA